MNNDKAIPNSPTQPWKQWYKPTTEVDSDPLAKPISLGRGNQGSLPQKPRNVDLSQPKSTSSVADPE